MVTYPLHKFTTGVIVSKSILIITYSQDCPKTVIHVILPALFHTCYPRNKGKRGSELLPHPSFLEKIISRMKCPTHLHLNDLILKVTSVTLSSFLNLCSGLWSWLSIYEVVFIKASNLALKVEVDKLKNQKRLFQIDRKTILKNLIYKPVFRSSQLLLLNCFSSLFINETV